MLCYIISKRDYEDATNPKLNKIVPFIFIGRINDISDAKSIASTFPIESSIETINKCCFIIVNI